MAQTYGRTEGQVITATCSLYTHATSTRKLHQALSPQFVFRVNMYTCVCMIKNPLSLLFSLCERKTTEEAAFAYTSFLSGGQQNQHFHILCKYHNLHPLSQRRTKGIPS